MQPYQVTAHTWGYLRRFPVEIPNSGEDLTCAE